MLPKDIVGIFSDIWHLTSERDLAALQEHIVVKQYNKNAIIYRDDDKPTHLMLLISGKVKVYKDGISGRNQIIRVVKPYECFAYRAYYAGQNYQTSAVAIDPCVIAMLPFDVLTPLLYQHPSVSMFFINHLARELGASDLRTVNLTQKHIRGRLAEVLLFLRDNYGVEEDGYTISIYLSREELANLANMTTSNAIRTLSAFANDRLIGIDGRKIKILQEDKLRRISEVG